MRFYWCDEASYFMIFIRCCEPGMVYFIYHFYDKVYCSSVQNRCVFCLDIVLYSVNTCLLVYKMNRNSFKVSGANKIYVDSDIKDSFHQAIGTILQDLTARYVNWGVKLDSLNLFTLKVVVFYLVCRNSAIYLRENYNQIKSSN